MDSSTLRLNLPEAEFCRDFCFFRYSAHPCVEQDSFALVTHHHYVVTVRINGPSRIHLDHGKEVVDDHAVANINGVDVATFLENEGDIAPVRMEHHINYCASDHIARLSSCLQT